MYLEIMSLVYPMPVVAILREYCSRLSLIELREYAMVTYEALTDLSLYHNDQLATGTPAHQILPGAFLDILFGGSLQRSGTLF